MMPRLSIWSIKYNCRKINKLFYAVKLKTAKIRLSVKFKMAKIRLSVKFETYKFFTT